MLSLNADLVELMKAIFCVLCLPHDYSVQTVVLAVSFQNFLAFSVRNFVLAVSVHLQQFHILGNIGHH